MKSIHHRFIFIQFAMAMLLMCVVPNEIIAFQLQSTCGLNIPIPEDNCTQGLNHSISVSTSGSVLGIDVELSELRVIIDHEWELDLRLFLVSPNGTRVTLSLENGSDGTESNYGDLNFPNCEAFTSFTSDPCMATYRINDPFIVSNFIGSFFPEGEFSDFDGQNPNGNWTLEICDKTSGANSGTLEFAELIFRPIYCKPPSNAYVSNVSYNNCTLNWTPNTLGASALIEVVKKGEEPGEGNFSPSGGDLLTSLVGTVLVPDLEEATGYDIYIRESCDGLNFSKNTCVLSIQTDCQVSTISGIENFDGQSLCTGECGVACPIFGTWSNAEDDDFDWIVYQGPTESQRTGPSADFSGSGNYIYIETTEPDCRQDNRAVLNSNCIFLNSLSNSCHLSFQYHMFGLSIGNLFFQIQPQGSADWVTLWEASGDQGDQWHKAWIDLGAYNNTFVKFRFYADGAFNTTGDIALDEITFYGPIDNGGSSFTFYRDADSDGYGDTSIPFSSCSNFPPSGFVNNNFDCDDANGMVNPASPELTCNGIDDNCNGISDDDFVADPLVYDQVICSNLNPVISISSEPQGEIYWYEDQSQSNLIGTGDQLFQSLNSGVHTIFCKDSITYGPGLKITEVQLSSPFQLELQSIGVAGDYTGWKVIINSSVVGLDINNFVPTIWELGFMERDEVILRDNNDWSPPIYWTNNLTGWALIIDENYVVKDAVFWNWEEEEMNNFAINLEGVDIIMNDVPWFGHAIDVGACAQSSIALIGDTESNSWSDYECMNSSVGIENPGLNFRTACSSNLRALNVTVIDAPIVNVELDVDPCANSSISSAIDVQVLGPGGPFSYSWSNGSSSEDQINLPEGNYSVTVTSANGCSTIVNDISIGQNSSTINSSAELINDVSCFGSNDGMAIVEVTDGAAPFQFNWSIGLEEDKFEEKDTLLNLSGGDYSVTITDNNGCTSVTTFAIEEPEEFSIDLDLKLPTCQNTDDGEISVGVTGAVTPYDYTWSTGDQGSPNLSNITSGNYSLTIEDANGCIFLTDEIQLSPDQDTIRAEILYASDVACFGDSTGLIEVSVAGGDKPLTYEWSNGSNTKDLENLAAGFYSLTISDAKGCTLSIESQEIFQAPSPLTYEYSTINTSCLGICDGSVLLTANGGIVPYEYEWENGGVESTQHDLCSGFVGLTIRDAFGCEVNALDVFIDHDESDMISIVDVDSVLCYGQSNGNIFLDIVGGLEPYSYDWDKAPDIEDPQFLISGTYNCTVTDAAGCMLLVEDVNIPSPEEISISLIESVGSKFDEKAGSLKVQVEGGTFPYIINWYNAQNAFIGEGDKLENLNPGLYRIQLLDFNSCMAEIRDLEVENLTSIANLVDSDKVELFPNPVNELLYFEIDSPKFKRSHDLKIYNALGQLVYNEVEVKSSKGSIDVSILSEGYYLIQFEGDENFKAQKSFIKL